MIAIINQVFEIQQKLQQRGDTIADRNFKRIYHEFETLGYNVIDPAGRDYKETDTDIEATLSGGLSTGMKITRVLKPIIYQADSGLQPLLVQKGIVIAEGEQK
ncbi:hypothetical protein [Mucilaginibacter celer]|uniref:Nucleotide exchange factor GrpE n=1 Tax=Mucilaginibacter celer TaxID=2305508 RepID=A0A494VQU1_9SPHI|nr:hypothetical protein [Mucilaginibacter celer]AYL97947.1 hypothetical protein HYN43_022810 [Mucilaginibacter celer]